MKKLFVLFGAFLMAFGLAACGDRDSETRELIEDAISRLQFSDMDNVTATYIDFPTELRHGVQVEWESSDTDVIDVDGVVMRTRGEDKTVTMTATFTLDGVSETRDYVFTVRGTEGPSKVYTDFADIYEDNPSGLIAAEGIVTSLFDGGFFFWDGTVHFAVFRAGRTVAIGDKVEVLGTLAGWQSLLQFSSPDEVTIVSSGHEVNVPVEEISLEDLNALDPDEDMTIHGRHYRITAEVFQSGSYVNLRDGDDVIGIYSGVISASLEAIEAHMDEFITIDVVYYARTSSFALITFDGGADDITVVELTDQDMAERAKDALTLSGLGNVTDDLTLPTTGLYDATITWTSDDETIIATDGTVTRPEFDNATVILTAHITVGEVTLTKAFTANVLAEGEMPSGDTVASIRGDNWPGTGEDVTIEGVVSSHPNASGEPGFFLQDADGTAIYVQTDLDVSIGDYIVITAITAEYTGFDNERQQLTNAELVITVDTDQSVFVIDDMDAADIFNALPGNEGFRYRLEDLELIEITQWDEFLFYAEDMELKFYFTDYGMHLADTLQVGDTLDWIEFTVFELAHGHLLMVAVVLPELEGAALDEFVTDYFQDTLTVPNQVSNDMDLPEYLNIYAFDYANPLVYEITWASSDETVIDTDGSVTQPDEGESNVDVTLTATITVDGAPVSKDFVVTVLAQQDAYVHDFGTETNWGYSAGTLTWTNTDGQQFSAEKDRVQINTQDQFEPHIVMKAFLVFAPRAGFDAPWIEFDFSDENAVEAISFEFARWSPTAYSGIMALDEALLVVEFYDEGADDWIEIGTVDLHTELDENEYVTAYFDAEGPGTYRITFETVGTLSSSSNTAHALTLDNLTIHYTSED